MTNALNLFINWTPFQESSSISNLIRSGYMLLILAAGMRIRHIMTIVGHAHAYHLRKHGGNIVAVWCNADQSARAEGSTM